MKHHGAFRLFLRAWYLGVFAYALCSLVAGMRLPVRTKKLDLHGNFLLLLCVLPWLLRAVVEYYK